MVFRVFIVFCLFRTSGKKRHLDENDFPYYYGNLFESGILKVIQSSFPTICEAHSRHHFERHSAAENFTDMDQHTC